MSLGRSFAYAGVKSLLVSRWEVPDYTAPQIMKYFYDGLKEGMKKSEALRYAQTQFLANDADDITSAPFYWSGFYIIGDDSPISSNQSGLDQWIYWLLVVALLVVGALAGRRLIQRA